MRIGAIIAFLGIVLLTSSCVSKKEYQGLQARYDELQSSMQGTRQQLEDCNQQTAALRQQLGQKESTIDSKDNQIEGLQNRIGLLERELEYQKESNTNLLERLSDLSVLSKAEAENVRKTLESLDEQNQYIKDLTNNIQRKDSINLALVMNLKRSLDDINDEDIQIEVKKGVVYVSISDKLLFKSGSAEISPRATEVLGKVAKVLNDRKDIEIMVEGHTDDVPISTNCLEDNWDLSVKRATAVVRLLQWRYDIEPKRMTAAGRSQYVPKASNETASGRAENRRTEIIITPKLDQFFKLLETPPTAENPNSGNE